MSSPIHHDKDVDPALVYAPRRAREQMQQVFILPAAPQIELPARSFSGDRGMFERHHAPIGEDRTANMRCCRRCSCSGRVGHHVEARRGAALGQSGQRRSLSGLGRDTTRAAQSASRRCRKGDAGT